MLTDLDLCLATRHALSLENRGCSLFSGIACFIDSFLFSLPIHNLCCGFQIWLTGIDFRIEIGKETCIFPWEFADALEFHWVNYYFIDFFLRTNAAFQIQIISGIIRCQASIVCTKFSMAHSFPASLFLISTNSKNWEFMGFLTLIEFLFSRILVNYKIL